MTPTHTPLPFTTGVEYTFLEPVEAQERYLAPAHVYMLQAHFDRHRRSYGRIYADGLAVEITTPVLDTLEALEAFYAFILPEVTRLGLVTHRSDTVSGGGHIHLGIPAHIWDDPLLALCLWVNVARDVLNRPYLNWFFNDPFTKESAASFVGCEDLRDAVLDDAEYELFQGVHRMLDQFDRKGYAVRLAFDLKTIEFRFFDAPVSWEESRKFVEFAGRYLQYLIDLTERGIKIEVLVHKKADIRKMANQPEMVFDAFKKLVVDLGLNFSDYAYLYNKRFLIRKKNKLLV